MDLLIQRANEYLLQSYIILSSMYYIIAECIQIFIMTFASIILLPRISLSERNQEINTQILLFRLLKMTDYQNAFVTDVCTIWKISMILERHALMQWPS